MMERRERIERLRSAIDDKRHDDFLALVTWDTLQDAFGIAMQKTLLAAAMDGQNLTERYRDLIKVVNTLSLFGANVNAEMGTFAPTPLAQAADTINVIMVKYLLDRGADMRASGEQYKLTAIQRAGKREKALANPRVSKLFMMHGARPHEFGIIAGNGRWIAPSHTVYRFYAHIERTRATLTTFIGLRRKSRLLAPLGKDIVRYLAKIIYQTRDQKCWAPSVKQARKRHAP